MKDLIIIGAGGMGRDVAWLTERINKIEPTWNLLGFVDDNSEVVGTVLNGYEVIGTTLAINKYPNAYFVCTVACAKTREKIIKRIKLENPQIKFATLIDPTVELSDYVEIGEGCIICANTLMTLNIKIGNHVIINANCIVGHDGFVSDYVTMYPAAVISGNTYVGACVELGTGMKSIQGLKIGNNSIVGAGAVVIRDIPENCTAVGNPAKPIKFRC